ncbi:MAG: endonuclease/exonuclease/phosphatase family protein [Planctomycetia bacterium]|nr:endonuclease/exonuclease/phosphatase family protein [Planctomycetia bacterium]MCC7314516.1 endonuclease/exonuclease/phosphatase family protein [Planctomycetota bacterium]
MMRAWRFAFLSVLLTPTILWAGDEILPSDAGLPVVDWKEAPKYMDKEVIVQGRIVQGRNIGRITFLNFDSARTFTAVVHKENYKNFTKPAEQVYPGKLVRIRGIISAYQGKPQIDVSRPEQVTILEKELPLREAPTHKAGEFNGTVTVATFNVLNLFDEYDDPYHADEGTPAKPKAELERLAATIRKVNADVIALEEIENRGYLERFNAAMLADLGYQHVVCFDSNDRRGIDCAILSRLPVGPVTSYRHLQFSDGSGGQMSFSRDLLRARIEPPDCKAFDLFVIHYKSKRGGAAQTEKARVAECTKTREIFDEILKDDPKAMFLICGDFNDTFDSKPLKVLRGAGATALVDFTKELPEKASSYNRMRNDSVIDFILASPAMAKTHVVGSYKIIPGTVETAGSDHNPVVTQFKLR